MVASLAAGLPSPRISVPPILRSPLSALRQLTCAAAAALLLPGLAPAASIGPYRSEPYYSRSAPWVFFHNMGGVGLYPYDNDTIDYLSAFDQVWSGNEYAMPPSWVDQLHTRYGRRRPILFYEVLPAIHFVFGKDNPQPYEAWKTAFLDQHPIDFYTFNPLTAASGYSEFSRGRLDPSQPFHDYFFNYGAPGVTHFLCDQYVSTKAASWGYDGVFFDLAGSYFLRYGEIEDPTTPTTLWDALELYDVLASTRTQPGYSYDRQAAEFLRDLKSCAAAVSPGFPVMVNQAFRSVNSATDDNEYYRYVDQDLDESTFTTWYNPAGWKQNVSVTVDGVVHGSANPVETRIVPFFTGLAAITARQAQIDHARTAYGHDVEPVVTNYVRPYYQPISGGYRATVDREAIYYGYATGKLTGTSSFSWDFFDTLVPLTGIPGAPLTTGIPAQPYYKWAKDSLLFLDLGDPLDASFETLDLGSGKKAVLRFFPRGFVVVNASQPPADIVVSLAAHPALPGGNDGVSAFLDHFTGTKLPSTARSFPVPAAPRPLEGVLANSARVFSYVDASGLLVPRPDGVRCAPQPRQDCSAGGEADFLYDERRAGREKMQLRWRSLPQATARDDFGNPLTKGTSLAVCVYDDRDTLVLELSLDRRGGDRCGASDCWHPRGTTGFLFRDASGSAGGFAAVSLLGGVSGKGRVEARGRNNAAKSISGLPRGIAAALSGSLTPSAQLVTSAGYCVGSRLHALNDDGLRYRATGD